MQWLFFTFGKSGSPQRHALEDALLQAANSDALVSMAVDTEQFALLALSGCFGRVQRGPAPLYYRTVEDRYAEVPTVPQPVVAAPEKPASAVSQSVIFKRTSNEQEVERLAEERVAKEAVRATKPVEKVPSAREKEELRLRRLLDMEMISQEEFNRRMGVK